MTAKDKIILALDISDGEKALEIVDRFSEHIGVFKVGLELFSSAGPSVVTRIHEKGKKVFLDLKLHDIPNTVSKAAVAASRLGVYMFNVHTSGGYDMMRSCRDAVDNACVKEGLEKPRILGVTVLTSLAQETLHDEFGIRHSLRTHVKNLSALAQKSGLDGVVASGHEVSMIRQQCGDNFLIVSPGIRSSWSPPDDQKRTMTPRQALKEGADYLVMGRGILNHPEPLTALELITLEILTV